MSHADGWAAIHLEMPSRVPHTEYSLETHWGIVRELTGLDITPQSPPELQARASFELMQAVNYDFRWHSLLRIQPFGDFRTRMIDDDKARGSNQNDYIACPFKFPEEVLRFNFKRAYGIPDPGEWKERFDADYQQRTKETPNLVNTTGISITLVSGLLEIFGWEMLLLAAGTDLQAFGALANRYADWVLPYFQALAESSAPVVIIQDDIAWESGPIFSPGWYQQFVFPAYKKLFAPLLDAKKKIIFSSRGNFTRFIDDLVNVGAHGFVLEPSTEMAELADKHGQTHVFIGNMNSQVLLNGSRAAIRAEVERCMKIGKNCPGFIMATGTPIPSQARIENVLYYLDVYEELSKR